jgi:hypothetical protein
MIRETLGYRVELSLGSIEQPGMDWERFSLLLIRAA